MMRSEDNRAQTANKRLFSRETATAASNQPTYRPLSGSGAQATVAWHSPIKSLQTVPTDQSTGAHCSTEHRNGRQISSQLPTPAAFSRETPVVGQDYPRGTPANRCRNATQTDRPQAQANTPDQAQAPAYRRSFHVKHPPC